MAKRVVSEDEESEDEPDPSPPPKRTRIVRKPSQRQAEINKENEETEQSKIKRMEKEIAKLKRKNKQAAEEAEAEANRNSDIESEDEPGDEIAFSSSIQPLATTANSQPKTPKPPRRVKLGPTAPKAISSRAFLTVPVAPQESTAEQPMSSSLPAATATSSEPTTSLPAYQSFPAPPLPSSAPAAAAPTTSSATITIQTGTELKVPPFAEGYRAGGKAKAADYEPVVCALLLRAMHKYEAMVSTKDAFPDPLVCGEWARMCWQQACALADEQYQLTARMSNLIGKRGSRVRSEALSIVRGHLASFYGFNLNTTPRAVDQNRTLAAKLLSGSAFHHKDPDTKTEYGQNKIISDLIHLIWFDGGKQSAGIIYSELFNPITLETLALIFTLIEFCLKEWLTGQRTPVTFFEKNVKTSHEAHRTDLKKWSDLNVSVIRNIRTKLYTRAKRNSGVVDENAPVARLTGEAEERARAELAGRTGETDSEAEDED